MSKQNRKIKRCNKFDLLRIPRYLARCNTLHPIPYILVLVYPYDII